MGLPHQGANGRIDLRDVFEPEVVDEVAISERLDAVDRRMRPPVMKLLRGVSATNRPRV